MSVANVPQQGDRLQQIFSRRYREGKSADMTQALHLIRRLKRTVPVTNSRLTSLRIAVLTLGLVTGSIVIGCSSGGDGGEPSTSAGQAVPNGPSASLAWDPVAGVLGYVVHYGPESPGSPGSCTYAESVFSSTPSTTVTGLAANTTYYFSVSAFNGIEGPCSVELSTVTGSA